MKKLLSAVTILLLTAFLLTGCSDKASSAYPKPTERFFVNDFADVITEADENDMFTRAVALAEQTTAQVVTVTVKDLNGEEPSEYALNLGREWGVGEKDKDNGVVILLSESDRKIYIAVGYGLEGALPDSKTGRIIDRYGLEHLRANDFSLGLLAISKAVINEIYIEYGLAAEEGYTAVNDLPGTSQGDNVIYIGDGEYSEGYVKKVMASWVLLIVLVVLFMLVFGRKGIPFFWFGGRGGFGGGFGGGGFMGGGHGGFSGGGGGFHGGGGSFGGGGAGRGF